MKLFLAGSGWEEIWISDNFYDFYRLASFIDITQREIGMVSKYKMFLLDSGAFTFMKSPTKGEGIVWEEYVDKYINFINTHDIEYFFELDLDSIIGLPKVEELRRRLELGVGRPCIPVWHRTRGLDYWKTMVAEYSYVGIGGVATKKIKRSEYNIFHFLLEEADKKDCKVHGLGFTNPPILKDYDFFSVDSTSWMEGSKYGRIRLLTGDGRLPHIKPTVGVGRRMNGHKANRHNFYEWVKFSRFMDKYERYSL